MGLPGWHDYHPERVWANELPGSEQERKKTRNKRVHRGVARRSGGGVWANGEWLLLEGVLATWEHLADQVGLPDAARRWRWCPWPRSPFETEASGTALETDTKRLGKR
jgi:hypothetical protein